MTANKVRELNEIGNFFATVSLDKTNELKGKVQSFITRSKQLENLQKFVQETSDVFNLLLSPEDVNLETLSMIKVVVFNEFAKTANVSLDDVLFALKHMRKQLLEAKDALEGKKELPVGYIIYRYLNPCAGAVNLLFHLIDNL